MAKKDDDDVSEELEKLKKSIGEIDDKGKVPIKDAPEKKPAEKKKAPDTTKEDVEEVLEKPDESISKKVIEGEEKEILDEIPEEESDKEAGAKKDLSMEEELPAEEEEAGEEEEEPEEEDKEEEPPEEEEAEPQKEGILGKLKKKGGGKPLKEKKGFLSKFKKPKKGKEIKQSIVRGADLKEGKVDYDENVITSDEFDVLENEEKMGEEEEVKEKAPEFKEKPASEASMVDQMVMKVERIEGRLEAMDEMNRSDQERVTGLSEEIGELRSSLLEKEKALNQIENQAKKVIEVFEEIEPENFRKELEKKEEEIIRNQAKLESLSAKQEGLKQSIGNLEKIMEKVKSFENLVEMSEKITEKFSQIEENKKYTARLASKVENIFSELNNRMKEFKGSIEKVEMNDETIKELMKSVDMMQIRVEKVVTKDQLEKNEKNLKEEMNNSHMELEDRLYDLKDFLEDVIKKAGGVKFLKKKRIVPWRLELEERMQQIEKLLKGSEPNLNKISNIRKEIEELKKEMKGLRTDEKEIDRLLKGIEDLNKEVRILKNRPPETKKEIRPEPSRERKLFVSKAAAKKRIPENVKSWLRENIGKGYSAQDLRESLKKGGYDPDFVDIFLADR